MLRHTVPLPLLLRACVLAASLSACWGESGDHDGDPDAVEHAENSGATETNVAPAPCRSDRDCPDGVRCIQFEQDGAGGEGLGACGVDS